MRLSDSNEQALPQRVSKLLGGLASSPYDASILAIAVPALGSILLDAVMLLVDTGAPRLTPSHSHIAALRLIDAQVLSCSAREHRLQSLCTHAWSVDKRRLCP